MAAAARSRSLPGASTRPGGEVGVARRFRWPNLLPEGLDVVLELGEQLQLLSLTVDAAPSVGAAPAPAEAAQADAEETEAAGSLRRAILRCSGGAGTGVRGGGGSAAGLSALEVRLRRLVTVFRRTHGNAPLLVAPRLGVQQAGAATTGSAAAAAVAPPSAAAFQELFEDRTRQRPGPRLFVDRVNSNAAEVSWVPLGGTGEEAAAYELEVRRYRDRGPAVARRVGSSSGRRGGVEEPELESLGCFLAQGAAAARRSILRRLRPLTWHRVRCRALGSRRCWVSAWSEEVSFKTQSFEEAREAGRRLSANAFFAPSERKICAAVQGSRGGGGDGGVAAAIAAAARWAAEVGDTAAAEALGAAEEDLEEPPADEEDDDEGGDPGWARFRSRPRPRSTSRERLLPSRAEVASLRTEALTEQLNDAFGPPVASGTTVKDLLDARYAQGGWRDFVRSGSRCGLGPPEKRDERLQRMRLVIAAKELYEPGLADGNPWFMGPLHYGEETGDAEIEGLSRRILEAAAAAAGA
eukprot:TRINITY_DN24929_c0_g1_i1.p1 TRINITY_DN24929_c0_g1~~TRINITY_DN24929_c0_g1_i1.p1  ORF type:complete len:524 (+),score=131.56 TRINITY_DN24929_c0_g1_i1:64-1635(+)